MKVIAHRGYSEKYPENTMLAFRKAVEAGCDEIELDVHTSKDGVVMVIHDEALERTTDGIGFVRDYTCEELKRLNAGKLFAQETEFERIPTFEEYCAWAASAPVTTNIEIKTSVYYYEDIEEKVAQIIRRFGLEDRVMFSSFNHMSLYKMRQVLPGVCCGALVGARGMGNAGYYCESYGFAFYHPHFGSVTQETVAGCKARGIGMNVWTVNELEELERLYDLGCEGVITNDPQGCRQWLAANEGMKTRS